MAACDQVTSNEEDEDVDTVSFDELFEHQQRFEFHAVTAV